MIRLDLNRWSERQREAILARGENVLVSAGAGSGKTSVLIERIVNCIVGERPVDINQLLVVTFTDAAAGEMRHRLLTRLESLLRENASDQETQRYIQRQLSLLEQAHISTLHSFCMEVVRRNFLMLDIDPAFTIADETTTAIVRSNLVKQLVEEKIAADDASIFRQMLHRFGAANPEEIAALVFRLDNFSRSQPDPVNWLLRNADFFIQAQSAAFFDLPWAGQFMDWVQNELAEAHRLIQNAARLSAHVEELSSYAINVVEVQPLLLSALEMTTRSSSLEGLNSLISSSLVILGKSVRGKDHPSKSQVQESRSEAKKILSKVSAFLGRGEAELIEDMIQLEPSISCLIDTVIAFQQRYEDYKRRHGMLDFNDLEHYALKAILDDNSGEIFRLREQFAEIFVDEYQDTSPIQDAIVNAMSREDGNVFVVGDVKQSIYRFRMAEPNLFLDKYSTLGRTIKGKVIDLTSNYRSRSEVVHCVNYLFEQLFSFDFGGITYDDRAKMMAGALYPPSDSTQLLSNQVEFHLVERKDDDEGFDGHVESSDEASAEHQSINKVELSALEKEAVVMGERILQLMGKCDGYEPSQVWDAQKKEYRPIQYKDIVVLLRSVRGRMNTVMEVFTQMGIPVYGATSSGFYGTLEIQWLLAALSAVDNPTRELDFAALLRSPIGRFTDEEMARMKVLRRAGLYETMKFISSRETDGSMMRTVLDEELIEKVKDFMRQFRAWRQLARRQPAEVVLTRILEDSQFILYVLGMKDGISRQANVESLVGFARDFDQTSADGVYGFVTRAQELLALELDSGEAGVLGENADVVRVMTIHQSKGLEYPVVFLADLGKKFFESAKEQSFRLHRKMGFGPQFNDYKTNRRWKTFASVALDFAERSESLAEEARVLYVAMTRAREKLIMVGSASKLHSLVENSVDSFEPGVPTLPKATMLRATSYLDWLIPCVLRHTAGKKLLQCVNADEVGRVHGDMYHRSEVALDVCIWNTAFGQPLPNLASSHSSGRLISIGRSDTLADVRQKIAHYVSDDATDELYAWVRDALTKESTHVNVPGKVTATDLRRLWVAKDKQLHAESKSFARRASAEKLLDEPSFTEKTPLQGKDSGTLFHTFMQYADIQSDGSRAHVIREIERLVQHGTLTDDEAKVLPVDDIVDFMNSQLGMRIRKATALYREQTFFQRINLQNRGENPPFVVGQGVIDCLVRDDSGWLIIDYKTDRVSSDEVDHKAKEYAAQIAAYIEVVKNVSQDKSVEAYVYFVRPHVAVQMHSIDLSEVFE